MASLILKCCVRDAPFGIEGKFENRVGGPEKIPRGPLDEKFENVLGAPENKNEKKRVWAIAQDYLHYDTFKGTATGPLRREHKKRGAEAPPKPLPP